LLKSQSYFFIYLIFICLEKEIAGDCWNVGKHKPIALSNKSNFSQDNRIWDGDAIIVFPHFNDRRLKVLWECGKVGLFFQLFQVLCVRCGKIRQKNAQHHKNKKFSKICCQAPQKKFFE